MQQKTCERKAGAIFVNKFNFLECSSNLSIYLLPDPTQLNTKLGKPYFPKKLELLGQERTTMSCSKLASGAFSAGFRTVLFLLSGFILYVIWSLETIKMNRRPSVIQGVPQKKRKGLPHMHLLITLHKEIQKKLTSLYVQKCKIKIRTQGFIR